jgi:dTDP-4-dehydrorhamnose 3,5-epimerase
MLRTQPLSIPGLLMLWPDAVMDGLGWQSVIYRESVMAATGVHDRFIQDSIGYMDKAGGLRGLQYQLPPAAQALLLRILRGRATIAAVDLRRSSPSFGRAVTANLTYMGGEQLYIMPGFAWGWCSGAASTELLVKASAPDHPDLRRGINARDPALNISWPFPASEMSVAPGDIELPMLAEQPDLFD